MYSVEALHNHLAKGSQGKYLFFWGHQNKSGAVTKSCFSQWYDSRFEEDGIIYPTAEHYMMAEKARLFGDTEALQKIIGATNPGEAKALGRTVQNFDQDVWIKHRFEIVVRGNTLKFRDPALQELLLNTGDHILVEASPVDRIWGVGLGQDDGSIANPYRWKGSNLLGFALMKVRDQFRYAL
ncbi:MAG: NADAR family protein [Cyanobacteria bacterium P01_F01_bin.153]